MKVPLMVACLSTLLSPALQAQSIDPTFGVNGMFVTDFGFDDTWPLDMAVQPDGKILLSGWVRSGSDTDWFITRLTANGQVDSTFATDGVLTGDPGGGYEEARRLIIQPDGKVLLGVHCGNQTTVFPKIVRLLADGSPDNTFGSSGVAVLPTTAPVTRLRDMELLPDGRILVSNTVGDDSSSVTRLDASGSLDPTYGVNGVAQIPMTVQNVWPYMALAPSGDLVVVTTEWHVTFNTSRLTKFDPDGQLVSSFGSNGSFSFLLPGGVTSQGFRDIEVDALGRVLVSGSVTLGVLGKEGIARFTADGLLDSDFGNNGWVAEAPGYGGGGSTDLLIANDGSLLLGGSSRFAVDQIAAATVINWDETGILNPAFGSAGVFWFPNPLPRTAYKLIEQSDGTILVAGLESTLHHDLFCSRLTSNLTALTPDNAPVRTGGTIQLFPNPAGSLCHLQLNGIEHPTSASVDILDPRGRPVGGWVARRQSEPVHNAWALDIHSLAPGAYMVRVVHDQGMACAKLMVE